MFRQPIGRPTDTPRLGLGNIPALSLASHLQIQCRTRRLSEKQDNTRLPRSSCCCRWLSDRGPQSTIITGPYATTFPFHHHPHQATCAPGQARARERTQAHARTCPMDLGQRTVHRASQPSSDCAQSARPGPTRPGPARPDKPFSSPHAPPRTGARAPPGRGRFTGPGAGCGPCPSPGPAGADAARPAGPWARLRGSRGWCPWPSSGPGP